MADAHPTGADPFPDDFELDGAELRCPYDINVVSPKVLREWCRRLLEAYVA